MDAVDLGVNLFVALFALIDRVHGLTSPRNSPSGGHQG